MTSEERSYFQEEEIQLQKNTHYISVWNSECFFMNQLVFLKHCFRRQFADWKDALAYGLESRLVLTLHSTQIQDIQLKSYQKTRSWETFISLLKEKKVNIKQKTLSLGTHRSDQRSRKISSPGLILNSRVVFMSLNHPLTSIRQQYKPLSDTAALFMVKDTSLPRILPFS